MIATALLPLMFITPASEDPTPVGPAIVELVIADPATSAPLCDAYGAVISAIDAMGLGYEGSSTFVDASDAYLIVTLEGDSFRLDNEARDVFIDWLHSDCS
jgi:hypothetical protein